MTSPFPILLSRDYYLALLLERLRINHYYTVATCVWLIYDYFLTLPQEVDCIWQKPFGGLSLLFYVNRYGALALRVLAVIQGTPNNGPLFADRLRDTTTYDRSTIRDPPSEHRNHPLAPRLRHLGLKQSYRLPGFTCGYIADVHHFVYVFYVHLTPLGSSVGTLRHILEHVEYSGKYVPNYTIIASTIALDLFVLVFTAARTLPTCLELSNFNVKRSLSSTLLRDGSVYFLSLLLLNIWNILQIRLLNAGLNHVLGDALGAGLVSRLILSLRTVGSGMNPSRTSTSDVRPPQLFAVRFASATVDDFATPLEFGVSDEGEGGMGEADQPGHEDDTEPTPSHDQPESPSWG